MGLAVVIEKFGFLIFDPTFVSFDFWNETLLEYLLIFEKSEFKKLYNNKLESCLAGLAGFMATLSWFYAFTLMQASFVRALGQIEIFFSYLSSKYLFKEKLKFSEILGIMIFVSGVMLMLITRVD